MVSAVSAYLLMQRFGPAGIALGAAAAAWVNVSLNFTFLVRKLGPILRPVEHRSLAVTVVASIAAAWLNDVEV